MTNHFAARRSMSGLYALKPWYARRLLPVVDSLDAHRIRPDAISATGVVFAAAAGVVVALVPAGVPVGLLVGGLLAARLGCANMDGTLARRRAPRAFGGVVNELGDRLADLAALAGLAPHLGWPVAAVLLAAAMPSWISLCIAASGGSRRNGGPLGKTERCVILAAAAATGWFYTAAVVIAAGSLLTAGLRLTAGARLLRGQGRS
jgi:CDP-diacylglycerol--glycerol-3-phosphate 3-phosphatidyltransferase